MSLGDAALQTVAAQRSPAALHAWNAARKVAGVARLGARVLAIDPHAPDVDRARANRVASRVMCNLHGIDVDVTGRLPDGPAVLVANHIGYLDPITIASVVACVAVAKAEVGGWPLLGACLRRLGVLLVDREDRWSGARVLRRALRALDAGVPVLNFPEGTTTRGPGVLPFRRGIFGVARRAGVPIVPVRVAYDDPGVAWVGDATLLPHYVALAGRRSIAARVRFGAPIVASWNDAASDLAERARRAIAAGH